MSNRFESNTVRVALAVCGLLAVSGCATRGFVREQVQSLETKMDTKMEPTAERARSAEALAQDVRGQAEQAEIEAQMARDLALGNVRREEVRRVDVPFEFDSAAIPVELLTELDGVADDLQAHSNYMALVTGFTDATGDEEYNVMLAQRRAATVQRYLAERLGAEFVRLAVIGLGESLPVADNETTEGRARNRRTEVLLVRPAPTSDSPPTASR